MKKIRRKKDCRDLSVEELTDFICERERLMKRLQLEIGWLQESYQFKLALEKEDIYKVRKEMTGTAYGQARQGDYSKEKK